MSDHDRQNQPPNRRREKRTLLPAFIAIAAILLIVAGAAIFISWEPEPEPMDGLSTAEQVIPEPEPMVMNAEPAPEPENISAFTEPPPPEEPESQIVPGESVPTEAETVEAQCLVVADKLHGFFQHLDSRDYIRSFELKENSQAYFTALAYRLLDNPPVVSRESDDLYTILRNMAHFFRIIGKDNILLIKSILDRERDKIEDVAAEFYFWTSSGICKSDRFSFKPTLAKMYEYAGFFLNTMGGRSYLFRRDSRSRLLVNYYSILLVDQANEKGLNRHGIDITLLIPLLVREIESSNQLIYKENYLDRLYALLEKYQVTIPAI